MLISRQSLERNNREPKVLSIRKIPRLSALLALTECHYDYATQYNTQACSAKQRKASHIIAVNVVAATRVQGGKDPQCT